LYINPDNPASNFSPRVINFNQNVTVEMTPNGQLQLRRGADGTPHVLNQPIKEIQYKGAAGINDTFTNTSGIPSTFVNQEATDIHVETFAINAPSRLPDSSASGQTKIDGVSIGSNTPPNVTWAGLPDRTHTVDLKLTDPDAGPGYPGGFLHMDLRNIPASVR